MIGGICLKATWVFNCSREKSETGEHDMGKVSNEGEGGESCQSDMQGAGRTGRHSVPSAGALQYQTRRKTYSQILAVMLRNNKKYFNKSRVNASNNPPISQESFQKCAPECIRLHCPAGTWVSTPAGVESSSPLDSSQECKYSAENSGLLYFQYPHFIHFPYFPFPPLFPSSFHLGSLLSIMGLLQEPEKRNVRKVQKYKRKSRLRGEASGLCMLKSYNSPPHSCFHCP